MILTLVIDEVKCARLLREQWDIEVPAGAKRAKGTTRENQQFNRAK